ncbi:hypothetical protein SAMN05660662_1063 [Blastococcus aurantiacus]|uniref:Uncharacterized protein n=1 Tax=Blastococcus aurantiacus TaxID=1550231 RepID=A0A1G7I9T5_9ACTN|nr:hypothetical protein [Blastococcus aurantiacus]SDF09099.1 hypothetical protein SAMN05660662_1063 [Blastococcus aurantiacus]
MTLLWVGGFAVALGTGLLLFRRPLTAWNARGADAMRSRHKTQVSDPNDGYPRYIVGVGALILGVGVVLVVLGTLRL